MPSKLHLLFIVTALCVVVAAIGLTGAALRHKAVASPVIASPQAPISNHTTLGQSPRLGTIELGAFAPEAALEYGIDNPCLMALDDDKTYALYRQAIRNTYGADLSDMNYLGVGAVGWQARYVWFKDWLFRAAACGAPTIAIEPVGPAHFGAFHDGPEMQDLRQVFEAANDAGITVWVRFASECNLEYSDYSIYDDPVKIAQYRSSVRWFRHYMPSNVRLVFSPLINTPFLRERRQMATLRAMYVPGDYDRIGGTLYATSWMRPDMGYTWYYNYMSSLDPKTRFQICELGGSFSREDDIYRFMQRLQAGEWPKVDRVNLFAGELNSIAVNNHGHFGLVLPGQTVSYLHDMFAQSATTQISAAPVSAAPNEAMVTNTGMAASGDADWRSDEMLLKGTVVGEEPGEPGLDVSVTDVTDCLGNHSGIMPPRTKHVILDSKVTIVSSDGTIPIASLASLDGDLVEVSGWDDGSGTPLHASAVVVSAN